MNPPTQKCINPDSFTKLRTACELTLLFYCVGPWTDDKRLQWANKTHLLLGAISEATTKTLCDCVRAALEAK